jgi:predicted nucleic acid-binding protein
MAQERQYVDVNVFVYWLTNHPKFGEQALQWIRKIENSPPGQYITSTLTLYEALVIIAGLTGNNLKNKTLTQEVVKALTQIKGLTLEPLQTGDFQSALDLMADWRLNYEDALHLAVALRAGVQKIISNDKDFEATPIKSSF